MPIERKNLWGSTITMPGRPTLSLTVIDYTTGDRAAKEIPDTDLASTVDGSFSSKVINEGEWQVTTRFFPGSSDPAELLPHTSELVRLTFPMATGQTTAGKYEFNGHVTKVAGFKGGAEDRCVRVLTIKCDSKPVFTEGS